MTLNVTAVRIKAVQLVFLLGQATGLAQEGVSLQLGTAT